MILDRGLSMGDGDTASAMNKRIGFLVGGAVVGALVGLAINSILLGSAVGMGVGVYAGTKLIEEGA
jgi:hypothetical protein